jgi:hypothetical protein
MEEQSALLRTISHQFENLNKAIPELQAKVSKAETDILSLSNAQSSLINRISLSLILLPLLMLSKLELIKILGC